MAFSKGSSDKPTSTPPSTGVDANLKSSQTSAFLGSGSKVVGKLVFAGPAVLSGHIEGEIKADSRLEIGETAVVNAKVEGADIVVRGTIEGDVVATAKLELHRSGKIVGNVTCGTLHIEDGATFEGSCKMLNRSPRETRGPSNLTSTPGASGSSGTK